jgi:hypothetical protein
MFGLVELVDLGLENRVLVCMPTSTNLMWSAEIKRSSKIEHLISHLVAMASYPSRSRIVKCLHFEPVPSILM